MCRREQVELPRLSAHRGSGFSESDMCSWWRIDTCQRANNSGTKAAGMPQSQQPNSEHQQQVGCQTDYPLFQITPKLELKVTVLYKDGNFTLQRWVWGWEEGGEKIVVLVLPSKYALAVSIARISSFPQKYSNNICSAHVFVEFYYFFSLSIASILGFPFLTKEKNMKKQY